MITSRGSSHRLAITLGDPAGIGPEITARALAEADMVRARVTVFCDTDVLRAAFDAIGQKLPDDIAVVDVGVASGSEVMPGKPNGVTARAQVAYLEAAVSAALAGDIGGIVTAPISKAQAQSSGAFPFPGHTEFFAARFDVRRVAMMFAGPTIRAVLTTVHLPIARISEALSVEKIGSVIDLSVASLRADFAIDRPRIGVLGLNPHAGEGGMFGDEEARIITPAIEAARARHPDADFIGPLPPDAAFQRSCDLFVAMYHDQALIPIKLHSFESVVNVTLGLPIVRTSPDHGTAFDIAGQNKANHRPMLSALNLAAELVDNRLRETR